MKKPTSCSSQKVLTQAREDYEELYETEIKLNKDFNRFVLNYKAAYEGRNTRREQLIRTSFKKKKLANEGKIQCSG